MVDSEWVDLSCGSMVVSGVMNFVTQGWQITWPHGLVTSNSSAQFFNSALGNIHIAFRPFVNAFLQLGHTRDVEEDEEEEAESSIFSSVK